MSTRIPGFKGEYLWELDIAEKQLLALAEAFPADRYGWRPEGARSVSEVVVHIAAGNLLLLDLSGAKNADELYGKRDGDFGQRIFPAIAVNERLEKTVVGKAEAVAMLQRSLKTVRDCFTQAPEQELARQDNLFGEVTTIRRSYLRLLCHMHEHMGQLIAYTRAMGLPVPWPDWRESAKKIIEQRANS
jgi:uncharacterized damage-inducible protein DinB